MFRLIMRSLRKKDVALLVLMIAMIVVQVGLELKMPDYMSKITVLVQSKDGTMNEILRNGGLMLACAFGSMLVACVVKYITSVISASFLQHTSKKIFDKTGVTEYICPQQTNKLSGTFTDLLVAFGVA